MSDNRPEAAAADDRVVPIGEVQDMLTRKLCDELRLIVNRERLRRKLLVFSVALVLTNTLWLVWMLVR